ncbi:MAG TPA: FAD binding domain-containing protein [Pyrinomonadaceae bacterium]|nr:FAD binding domain-containing protein [Pyrinomonadaceae bacterium]
MRFILNDENIETDLPNGVTVLDFVRYSKNLKGTKIGCREGDCGACTMLVGELIEEKVRYRTMTSCLMPLANAAGKHIVSIEGINPADGSLTLVQQAMVEESGTQCGFCTVGFVMSLTGFCLDSVSSPRVSSPRVSSPHVSKGSDTTIEAAISAIDGNICRCTGYKSIERAACRVTGLLSEPPASAGGQFAEDEKALVPGYFGDIAARLKAISNTTSGEAQRTGRPLTQAVLTGGGTDLYVQRPDDMAESGTTPLFYDKTLRGIRDTGEHIEIGGSVTVTDLLESPAMQSVFPDLYKHLKLVSSTPIRNMATLAGNFVNASPIGDMTVWFLALDAEIDLCTSPHVSKDGKRTLPLKDLYLGYKQLAKAPGEIITTIRFRKPTGDFRFNFEKVSKRTYLDIATVNTALSLTVRSMPGQDWLPTALSEPPASAGGQELESRAGRAEVDYTIIDAHVSAGGVAPIPLYLKETSEFLRGKAVSEDTITAANEMMQSEIAPISDVRGTDQYKPLLVRQLFRAHFVEMFDL